jgi:type IV pilus assembly protein PilB
MLRDGYVTKQELEEILREQRDGPQHRLSGWRLGEILVERGRMTQAQVAALVAEQYELPYRDLDPTAVDPALAELLPTSLRERFSALPIEEASDGSLVLAVADPASVLFSDELRRTLGRPLRFVVVSQDDMERALAVVRGDPPADLRQPASWPSGGPVFALPAREPGSEDEAILPAQPSSSGERSAPGSEPERAVPLLGTLLVRAGLVDEDELEQALAAQRSSPGKRLGEVLVERGTLTRAQVARAVAEQYELPFVDLADVALDERVCALLPNDIARRYSALPLDFLPDGSLRLAVADPTKVLEPDEILATLGARLTFAVADPELVEAAIAEHGRAERSGLAWGIGPIGPPVSGLETRPAVDASDLIVVPADERGDELQLERRERHPVDSCNQAEVAPMEPRAESVETKRRRRGLRFWRRSRADEDQAAGGGTDGQDPWVAERSDEPQGDVEPPLAGLLEAGERAEAVEELTDPPAGTSVLRLWLASEPDDLFPPQDEVSAPEERDPVEERASVLELAAADVSERSSGDGSAGGVEELGAPFSLPDPRAETHEAASTLEPALGADDDSSAAGSTPPQDAPVGGTSLPDAPKRPWNIFAPTPLPPALEPAPEGDDRDGDPRAGGGVELVLVEDASEPEPREPDRWTATLAVASEEVATDSEREPRPVPDRPLEIVADAAPTDGVSLSGEHTVSSGADSALAEAEHERPTLEIVAFDGEPRAPDAGALGARDTSDREAAAPGEAVMPLGASWLAWEPIESLADPWRPDEADPGDDRTALGGMALEPVPPTEPPFELAEEVDETAPAAALDAVEEAESARAHERESTCAEDAAWASSPLERAARPASPTEPTEPDAAVAPSAPTEALAPIVERALALGATTLHFSAQEHGIVVRARVDGVLRRLDTVTGQHRYELARELVLAAQAGSLGGGHVTALPTPHGETVTVRFPQAEASTRLESLALDPADREAIERALRHSFGLVLLAGPTRSGRAETLSAALHALAADERAVMTIEDPILHLVPGIDQVAVDPTAGRRYADGLRAILSADPDAVVVGELVDEETAALAVDAATGHLVVTTVLAQSAVGALERLARLGLDAGLVASTVSLVVCQRLLRRLCDHCREGYYASAADTAALRRPDDEIGRRLLGRAVGCAECGHTGFAGTIGAYEVLVPNDEVRALVAAGAPATEVERAARLAGKRTLADDAVRLCLEGLTTVEELQRVLGRWPA